MMIYCDILITGLYTGRFREARHPPSIEQKVQKKEGLIKMGATEENQNVFASAAGEEMALEHLGYKQGTIIDKTIF
jgi:hypothetical protein